MKFKLTASAVLCAALVSGCSTAPTLAVPTGEWENFDQQPQSPPLPQAYAPLLPQPPADFNQGPATTVFKPSEVVSFTPPPGSTPVKPAAATIVLPVIEKAPVAPAQLLTSTSPATPAPITNSAATAYKAAITAPAVPPVASNPLKPVPGVPPTLAAADAKPVTPALPSLPPVAAVPAPKPLKAWKVSPDDKTIRETLAKWAKDEGWTFNPVGRDYWTVPQDFDVVASDTFHGDFKDVVRKLIASTELTSTPLQPCFFKNRAVRIILINEECAAQASQVRKL